MEHSLTRSFIEGTTPEFQKIVQRIVEIIDGSEAGLDCAMKWGQLTFARQADFHHWIAGIKITKNFVGLVFHFGGLLKDPNQVFISGSSKFGRKIEYRTVEDVDQDVILDFVKQALDTLPYFKEHWKEIQKAP